jgi:hypothetical protein
MTSETDDKKRQLVEQAERCFEQEQWDQAIKLFRESREICRATQSTDGVRYADEMIEKASTNYQKLLQPEVNLDAPLGQLVRIICPTCQKIGTVTVDRYTIDAARETQGDSLIRVYIFAGDICEHEFTVLLDAKFKAR